jgi:drug/metabolite transporter (DMT)-like permease
MIAKILTSFTAERASAALVCVVGAIVGAYAAYGLKHGEASALTPAQWAGAFASVFGAIFVAAMVHTRPAAATKSLRE